jgi:hypothetical protein
MRPTRYLRDGTSLISIALHVNEAACDLVAESIRGEELPASYHSYQMFTLTIVNPQLDRLAYLGAKFLEERGYRAYPFPANLPHVLKPSSEYPGCHRRLAVPLGVQRDVEVHRRLQRHPATRLGANRRGTPSLQGRSGPLAGETAKPERTDPVLRPMLVHLSHAE